MSRKTPTKDACAIASRLIDSFLDVGQPYAECSDANHPDDNECRHCRPIGRELKKLRDRLFARSRFDKST